MSSGASYPSPTATQVADGAAPFYAQSGGSPNQIPVDLQRLQHADISQDASMLLDTSVHHGSHYPEQDLPMDHNMVVTTSPDRMAQGVLGMEQVGDVDMSSAARKRSKVSRACDECRRKKIRCDATVDSLDEPCTSCKKNNVSCRFSRMPMKRGPSKGYIKELADRLNTLESQLNPGAHVQQQTEPHEYAIPSQAHMSRKRTFSMSARESSSRGVEGDLDMLVNMYSASNRGDSRTSGPAAFGDTRGQFRSNSLSKDGEPNFVDEDKLHLPNRADSPRAGAALQEGRTESPGLQYSAIPQEENPVVVLELKENDDMIDEYYRIVHPTLPLLPHSKARLHSRLKQASATLRTAFLLATDCAVRSSPTTQLKPRTEARFNTRLVAELISSSQYQDVSTRTFTSDLMYIQALILMFLEADNHGPAALRSQNGPPRSEWLGRAIGMANHLKLNVPRFGEPYSDDADADDKLARRVWWILFILDRWHASSTSNPLLLPDHASLLLSEDQHVLGESIYQLARLSYILGHLSIILQQHSSLMASGAPVATIINITILGEVDRFRESIETQFLQAPNLIHAAYWHVRLLVMRLTSSTAPHELLLPASRIATMCHSIQVMTTPLYHHFMASAALTLLELCEFDETRNAAERGIDDIIQALNAKDVSTSREDSEGWELTIRELVGRKRIRASTPEPVRAIKQLALQQLADAAIGDKRRSTDTPSALTAENTSGESSIPNLLAKKSPDSIGSVPLDPTSLARFGYLTALMQENDR